MSTSNSEDYKLFLEISVLLTGFTESELIGTGMLDTYYNSLLQNSKQEDISYFFQNVKAILQAPKRTEETTDEAIRLQLIPSSQYSALAKNIIMLWYSGSLFNMALTNQPSNIVNAEAYKQGLMWTAGHTHPPGAKQPGYGSWAKPPITVK